MQEPISRSTGMGGVSGMRCPPVMKQDATPGRQAKQTHAESDRQLVKADAYPKHEKGPASCRVK